jgi:uncharacterized ParB-like nuclease family protein
MATVRMSNDLKRTILDKATHAFDSANPEPEPSNDLEMLLAKAIRNMPQQKSMQKIKTIMEEDSLSEVQSFGWNRNEMKTTTLNSIALSINETDTLRSEIIYLSLSNPIDVLQLKGTSPYGYSPNERLYACDLLPEDQPEVIQRITSLVDRRKERNTKRSDYRISIESLMDKCNTLKQFLQAWPAAESLVPNHTISKMYEKATRVQRANKIREEVSFDDTKVNQVVLTAKLIGGL